MALEKRIAIGSAEEAGSICLCEPDGTIRVIVRGRRVELSKAETSPGRTRQATYSMVPDEPLADKILKLLNKE